MEREPRPQRSIFSGFLLIFFFVILCVGGLSIFLNARCQAQFNDPNILYPNAELVTRDTPFLGVLRAEYRTDDAPLEVEAWYNTLFARALGSSVRETGGRANELTFTPEILPNDNGGSQINLSRVCP